MPDGQADDNIIGISVKRVKDVYFVINEQLYVPDPNKVVKIELGERIGFSLEGNLVNFIFRIFLHYVDEPEILVDIHIENLFEVSDLKQFLNNEGVMILPTKLLTAIVGMSISHGRALLLKNTAGTRWENIVLPVTNPEHIARYFYPYMFNEESKISLTDEHGNVTKETRVNKKRKTANS
jgi:hypothetical protein